MRTFDLKDLHVVIGPSTSSSYEINDDSKNKFETLPIDSAPTILKTRGRDRHGIDFEKKANAELLNYYGVPKEIYYTTAYATSRTFRIIFLLSIRKRSNRDRMLSIHWSTVNKEEICFTCEKIIYNKSQHKLSMTKVKKIIFQQNQNVIAVTKYVTIEAS